MNVSRAALPAMALTALALASLAPACGDDGGGGAQTADVGYLDVPDNVDGPPSDFGAADMVTAAKYGRIQVEIDQMTGKGPASQALTDLEAALDAMIADGHLDKPGGVDFVTDETLPTSGGVVHTFAELDTVGRAYRNLAVPAGSASIHVLYVDGSYEDDSGSSRVLGFAYGGSFMVMFKDSITSGCASSSVLALFPLIRDRICARVEATVFLHELGHLFGLVNNGTPMVDDHQDDAHGAHDVDPDCLMYWQIDGTKAVDIVGQRFSGGGEPDLGFCPASLADLDAAIARTR
ncbi:MAG: hypothetical protein KC635_17870 [Myxococcales bacterium]|nr:hypothetical protein [Myxococcales bacterium]